MRNHLRADSWVAAIVAMLNIAVIAAEDPKENIVSI